MKRLVDSGKEVGITPINVIHGKWKGSDMRGPGGGQKLVDLKSYIERHKLPDNDVILFTDAYDVFFSANLNTIVSR
jgi:procollagen-lysine,2-oxoglutarate 5-dioxygenase